MKKLFALLSIPAILFLASCGSGNSTAEGEEKMDSTAVTSDSTAMATDSMATTSDADQKEEHK